MKSAQPSPALENGRARDPRKRLALHAVVLFGICALPLAGLAFYFLSTGLHREIAFAKNEQQGLRNVRQAVEVLNHAVRFAWKRTDDAKTVAEGARAVEAFGQLEKALTATLPAGPLTMAAKPNPASTAEVSQLWRELTATPPNESTDESLRRLVTKVNESVFRIADSSGLSSGPENQISALSDVVAVSLPAYVERLLHLHETLITDLNNNKWDASTRRAAGLFALQIEREDYSRLTRGIDAALNADLRAQHVHETWPHAHESLQHDFLIRAKVLINSVRQLALTLQPIADEEWGDERPRQLDEDLEQAFAGAISGWEATIQQLDHLVTDQIDDARAHRDRALLFTGIVTILLLPIGWSYFRFFITPIVETMVDSAASTQRQAEAARAEADDSTRRLRQTQAALDDHSAVLVVDRERKILVANDQMVELTGYPREELLQRPFLLFAEFQASDWAKLDAGQHWHGQLNHQMKDGTPFWVNATLFPLVNRDGRAEEFVLIATDITALVKAREAAESAAKAKSQFLAMMSHEIRTPMNGVIGFAQLLADTDLNYTQRDFARTILTSGESLMVIINDILDFSKLEAGRTELEKRPVALRLLVEDVLELLAAQARAKKVELVYELEPGVPEGIVGDGPRLRQILLNLAGNAVKFTSEGHVTVTIKPGTLPDGGAAISVHVRDTGIGIPPEKVARLFQAFSQVDASVSRTYGGTGLGLAISQRLVNLMGGHIEVNSVPGQGSDFYFTLPISAADVREELSVRAITDKSEDEDIFRGRRVLVVDDLPANRRLLESLLKHYGAEIASAESAAQAVDILQKQRFDLAILDYRMPQEDGIVLAKRIRADVGTQRLPLMLVTSVPVNASDTLDLFDAVMAKPLRRQPLLAAAAKALLKEMTKIATQPSAPKTVAGPNFAFDHPLRIVVVDDNETNVKVLESFLKRQGYAPALFNGAPSALEHLRVNPADLILMDVQMPELDGLEATRKLRAGEFGSLNQNTLVTALTAGAMAEEQAACISAGMDDFIAKPVSLPKLLEKIAVISTQKKKQATT